MGAVWLLNMADWLREGGMNVVEEPGWQTRSRSSGGYDAVWGIGVHHTASNTSPKNDINYMLYSTGNSARPIGALYLARDGQVTVMCAGATNTQGKGGPYKTSKGTIPQDAGNRYMLSIEAANAGTGEHWPVAQQDAYVRLCHILFTKLGLDWGDIVAHFEWTNRKYDPAGNSRYAAGGALWDMDKFRRDCMLATGNTTPDPLPEPIIELGNDIDMKILATPARIYDSRTEKAGKLKVGEARAIKLPKELASATAIHVTVTATEQEAHGFLTLWNGAGKTPVASNLNFAPGNGAVANTTITAVKNGEFKVYTQAVTHVVFDVVAAD